jgi:hypothetical protein
MNVPFVSFCPQNYKNKKKIERGKMNNQKVKLTNKLVNSFKSNTFTTDGKKGKTYFIQEETAPGLNLRVQLRRWQSQRQRQSHTLSLFQRQR